VCRALSCKAAAVGGCGIQLLRRDRRVFGRIDTFLVRAAKRPLKLLVKPTRSLLLPARTHTRPEIIATKAIELKTR